MSFVLDSSVALAWLLPGEASDRVDALADRLEHESAEVPAIWSLEVANALVTALRRSRIESVDVGASLEALATLPIYAEQAIGAPQLAEIVALALRHGLTAYDACYVELAHRRQLPLATLDAETAQRVQRAGHTGPAARRGHRLMHGGSAVAIQLAQPAIAFDPPPCGSRTRTWGQPQAGWLQPSAPVTT